MTGFIHDILHYQFLSNAVIACILSGIACGITGAYIVSRRLVFLSGGITHSSFGGIGIAYYLGMNPIAGALIFSVASAIGMEAMAQRIKIREDSAIGILWSLGMAVGIIFVALTPGYAPNLMNFLFGNILTISQNDIISIALLDVVLLAVITLLYRPILYIAFDRDYAATQNAPVKFISYMMMILLAVTIVLCIRLVGIVLLISLLTIPPVAVNSATKSFKKMIIYSSLISIAGTFAGVYIGYSADIPSGAATIVVLTLILIAIKTAGFLRKKIKFANCIDA